MMAKRYKETAHAAKVAEAKAQDLTSSLQDTRKETADLRLQVDELRVFEKKYLDFKQREPQIRHFLGNVTGLMKFEKLSYSRYLANVCSENTQMRRQLKQLGFRVPRPKYSMDLEKANEAEPPTNANAGMNGHADQQPHDSSSSGMRRPREVFLEDTGDEPNGNHFNDYELMPPPPKPQHRQQNQAMEIFSGGDWRNAHASDEDFAPPVHLLPQAQKQYMMGDALRPQQRQTNGSALQPRHDSQHVRSDEMDKLLAFSLPRRGQTEQRYSTDKQADYNAPINQSLPPPSDDGRVPQMRQPLATTHAPNSLHPREPKFNRIENTHVTCPRLLSRDPRAQVDTEGVDHGRSRTTSSPFFYDATEPPNTSFHPQMVAAQRLQQADQFLSSLDGMRMDVDVETPPKTQSLNDLSFIQQPYTRSNKPVYSRPDSRAVWSRAAAPDSHAQQYGMPAVQNRSYLPNPGPQPLRPTAPPPVPGSRQMQCRSLGPQNGGGFSGFAKSSLLNAPTYNASSYQTRFPLQQRSGVSTGNALRSIRR
jgi:hypothetical protein